MVLPLLTAAAPIIGALLSRQKPISSGDNAYSHVQGITKAAKDFGFNPLTLLGSVGAVGGTPGQSYVGSAIADAALVLADGYARRTDGSAEGARNALEQETRKLRQQLTAATIRPKIGGLYGGTTLTPSLGAALGRVTPGAGTAAAVARPATLPSIDELAPVSATPAGRSPVDDPVALMVPYDTPHGETVQMPVGPDIDQVVTGAGIFSWPWVRQNPAKAAGLGFGAAVGTSAAGIAAARSGGALVTGATGGARALLRRIMLTPPLLVPKLPQNFQRSGGGGYRPRNQITDNFPPLLF